MSKNQMKNYYIVSHDLSLSDAERILSSVSDIMNRQVCCNLNNNI